MVVTSDTDTLTTFTGKSAAQLYVVGSTSTSTTAITGAVNASGEIVMIFTPTAGGSTTIGLGQFASVDGQYTMEMQMITGSTLLITHWAHMLPITSGVTPTPATNPLQSGVNTGYSWT
ncbi:MAG: hypothetical protein HOL33_02065 [Tateyamaria sp.]|nr:hypothetical protein [Tateyamaria sp.]